MLVEIFLLVLLVYLVVQSQKRSKGSLPGAYGLPIIGHMPNRSQSFSLQVQNMAKKYGKIFLWRQGSRNFVFVTDYKLSKEIFQNSATAFRPDFYSSNISSNNFQGLIQSNGIFWQRGRRFALRHLRDFGFGKSSMSSIIQDEAQNLIQQFLKEEKKPVAISSVLNVAVLNIIWKIASDKRYDMDDPFITTYIHYMDEILQVAERPAIFMLDLFPWLQNVPLIIRQRFTKENVMLDNFAKIRCLIKKIVDEHRVTLNRDIPRDYIDTFLIEAEKQEESTEEFSEENLITNISDLFFAGSETSSTTLRWVILIMAKFPKIQERIQAEIDEVFERNTFPNWEERNKCPFTEAVINEVTRYASITPSGVPHRAIEDIPLGEYVIQKGSVIFTHIYSIHRDPEIWEKPNEFYPQHFFDEATGKLRKRDELIPFSVGRRQCLGESLAKLELFLFSVCLLQRLTFSLPDGADGDIRLRENIRFINAPKPYKVVITQRK